MLTSLSVIFLAGLSLAAVFQMLRLPRIVGMLVAGILLGPYVLNLLHPSILSVSADLRKMALVIILIKAGLSLKLDDLKKVGRPAVLLSFLPASFEIAAVVFLAPVLFDISRSEAAVAGAVLAAVSPAVVVPRMVQLMEEGYGTEKRIPQMVLAGASLDDVFVIVLFSSFLGIAQGQTANASAFLAIPVSIVSGIALGAFVGWAMAHFFELRHICGKPLRGSLKVIFILSSAFLLIAAETAAENILPLSALLAVISMALVIAMKSAAPVTLRLQEKFGKLWIAAELILFVLVGAAVDIRCTLQAGLPAAALLAVSLSFRSVGVWISLLGTPLNLREKLFCVIAYLPKATVQAAIGAIPLALGLPCGNIVLSLAVLAIIITAPLGALGIDTTFRRLLQKECD